MSKIKLEDLENWMDENGEHPIIDGPYCGKLDEDFYSLFRSKLSPELLAALVEYHELESVDELESEEQFCVDIDELKEYTGYHTNFTFEGFDNFLNRKFVETLNELEYDNLFI